MPCVNCQKSPLQCRCSGGYRASSYTPSRKTYNRSSRSRYNPIGKSPNQKSSTDSDDEPILKSTDSDDEPIMQNKKTHKQSVNALSLLNYQFGSDQDSSEPNTKFSESNQCKKCGYKKSTREKNRRQYCPNCFKLSDERKLRNKKKSDYSNQGMRFFTTDNGANHLGNRIKNKEIKIKNSSDFSKDPKCFHEIVAFAISCSINDLTHSKKSHIIKFKNKNLVELYCKDGRKFPYAYLMSDDKDIKYEDLLGIFNSFHPIAIKFVASVALTVIRGRIIDDIEDVTPLSLLPQRGKEYDSEKYLRPLALIIGMAACEAARGRTGLLNVFRSLHQIKHAITSEVKDIVKQTFPADYNYRKHSYRNATGFAGSQSYIMSWSRGTNTIRRTYLSSRYSFYGRSIVKWTTAYREMLERDINYFLRCNSSKQPSPATFYKKITRHFASIYEGVGTPKSKTRKILASLSKGKKESINQLRFDYTKPLSIRSNNIHSSTSEKIQSIKYDPNALQKIEPMKLKDKKLPPKGEISGDGNCLFRAVARWLIRHNQYYSTNNQLTLATSLREQAVAYMITHPANFAAYLTDQYIDNMLTDGTWGGEPEIVALCSSLKVNIWVVDPDAVTQCNSHINNNYDTIVLKLCDFQDPHQVMDVDRYNHFELVE